MALCVWSELSIPSLGKFINKRLWSHGVSCRQKGDKMTQFKPFPEGFLWGGATAANQCEGAYNVKQSRESEKVL